jgi:hypothetical protein
LEIANVVIVVTILSEATPEVLRQKILENEANLKNKKQIYLSFPNLFAQKK